MPWRQVEIGDQVWNISIAAERQANSDRWGLVLSFRGVGPNPRHFWAPYPIHASSKGAIYSQAETLSDQELATVLTEHLSRG
jgi:hypothetical protein